MGNALKGIVELIASPGIINVDFADVKTVIEDAGSALVGLGIAGGQDRAATAVGQAMNSPLLEVSPEGAKGVLLSISGRNLKMNEIREIAKVVAKTADPSAKIIFGAYHDRKLRANQLKVTLVATGFNGATGANSLFQSGAQRPRFLDEVEPSGMDGHSSRKNGKKERAAPEEDHELPRKSAGALPRESAEEKKKDADIWDIPTFLRKRRK